MLDRLFGPIYYYDSILGDIRLYSRGHYAA